MTRERIDVIPQFLMVLLITLLALPAWGAPNKKNDMFGNVALVSQGVNTTNNLVMTMARVATYSSPVAAMNHLGAWCGTPSEDNPCLIKILPGVYNLGAGTLTMQPFVDIEGSGETTTFITSAFSDSALTGVVNGADKAEIRLLTVKSTSTSGYAVAIANKSQSPKITHVTAIATGTLSCYGIYNSASSPVLSNVTVTASESLRSYGVYDTASSPTMNNVTVSASSTFESFGVYNADSSAPVMSGVAISTDGHFSNGVYNLDSSPVMRNVTVTTNGLNSYGMTNLSSSAPVMNDVTITSLAGTNGYGMSNQDSSPSLTNVTVASQGLITFGITNSSSSPVTITADRCTFQGRQGIANGNNVTMKIGGSKIVGGVGVGDGLTCSGSYDGNFAPLGPSCK